jgi:hypothetical protein
VLDAYDGLFYIDGSLFEGRAGFWSAFLEELDLKASLALETFATVLKA